MENENLIRAGPWIFGATLVFLLILRFRSRRLQKEKEKRLMIGKLLPGIYEHYKGKRYELICVGRNSETSEYAAVYQEMEGEMRVWTRPLKMFLEEVETESGKMPRFRYLGK
jgi:hypothetical protein